MRSRKTSPMIRYGRMVSTGPQPAWDDPPSNQEKARRSSPVERYIRNDVMAVAKELKATPARIRLVVGTVFPIRARL